MVLPIFILRYLQETIKILEIWQRYLMKIPIENHHKIHTIQLCKINEKNPFEGLFPDFSGIFYMI